MRAAAGWLWAWLRAFADIACLGSGFGFTVLFGITWWLPFMAAAAVLLCAVPVIRRSHQQHHVHMDPEHPAVKAAAQRDPEVALLYELWNLESPDTEARKEQRSE